MRLTRIFVDAELAEGAALSLPPAAAAHLTRVLRLGVGDPCVLFNGRGGEYAARVASTGRRDTVVALGAHDPVERELPRRILLLQALARGERMDLIVQKATELGVAALRPVHTQHSGVRLDAEQAARKLDHWRGVAISACEQCRRNRLPVLLEPLALREALQAAPAGTKAMLSLREGAIPLAISPKGDEEWATVLIGPEGGFDAEEEVLAAAAGFSPCTLGPRVLRTETAAIAALAVLGAGLASAPK